jgi:hypothetical protein
VDLMIQMDLMNLVDLTILIKEKNIYIASDNDINNFNISNQRVLTDPDIISTIERLNMYENMLLIISGKIQ